MRIEVRADNTVRIEGYVNVVERESRPGFYWIHQQKAAKPLGLTVFFLDYPCCLG